MGDLRLPAVERGHLLSKRNSLCSCVHCYQKTVWDQYTTPPHVINSLQRLAHNNQGVEREWQTEKEGGEKRSKRRAFVYIGRR